MFDPLHENFQFVGDLPKCKFTGDSDGDFITVLGRFVHGVRRDGIGLSARYLTGVYRIMGRVEVPTPGVRKCCVAFYLCTLCCGYLFPFRITGRSVLATQTRSNEGRGRLVIKLRSNFRRLQGILYLLTNFVGECTGKDRPT